MKIAKLDVNRHVWIKFDPDAKPKAEEQQQQQQQQGRRRKKKGRGGRKNNKQPQRFNLKNKPWALRDGDLIAVANASEDPEDSDDWRRAEDCATAFMAEDLKLRRKEAKKANSAKGIYGSGSGGSKYTAKAQIVSSGEKRGGGSDVEWTHVYMLESRSTCSFHTFLSHVSSLLTLL